MNAVLSKVKKLLDERDWTLYQLAKTSGIPYSSLNALYQRNHQPTIATLEKICDGFKITLGEFFSDCTPYREGEEKYSRTEQELIKNFRKLGRRKQKYVRGFVDMLLEESGAEDMDAIE